MKASLRNVWKTGGGAKVRNLAAGAVAAALCVAMAACSGEKAHDVVFADDRDLGEQAVTVDSCYTADTVFTFGANRVDALEIARIFPTEHDDVYISMRVYALRGDSRVNIGLSRIVSENFDIVSGGDVHYDPHDDTARAVERQMDYYGKVFTDTILPQLRESVKYGFFLNMDLRPAWTDGSGLITYSSYVESCGGAVCDVDAYYITFDTTTGKRQTFDLLVPDRQTRTEIRRRLVDEIAASRNLSTEQYLHDVSTYRNPDSMVSLTAEDFPIYYVARLGDELVFSYPQGTIAPFREGCPIYHVATDR